MNQHEKKGIMYAGACYLLWGVFPIYWKWLEHVAADEILANRILWSFVFMVIFLLVTSKWRQLKSTVQVLIRQPKQIFALIAASLLISGNWFMFIWAVNSERVIETSLGYYINPLMSVLLGVFILRESLSKVQIFSFFLAGAGVLILAISYGHFPWVSLTLAVTFGLYGLAKKLIKLDASVGLTLETLVVSPLALGYLFYLLQDGRLSLFSGSASTDLLLISGGMVTAIPLLLFAHGAQRIPLYMIGILQYITPTMTHILGVLVYHEPFSLVKLGAFACIWCALLIFSLSQTKRFQNVFHRKQDKIA